MQSNNSVIFLDEIIKVKSNSKNDSNSLNSEITSTSKLTGNQSKSEKNVLNGIKFGFIDSSSSDDEIDAITVTMPAAAAVAEMPEPVKEEPVDKLKSEEVKSKKKLLPKYKQHQSKSSTSSSTTSSAFSSHMTMATTTSSTSSTDDDDDYDSDNLNPTTTTTSNTNSATGMSFFMNDNNIILSETVFYLF